MLWSLQFIAYAVVGAIGDDFEAEIFITDVIAVAGGVAIAVGAGQALVQRRRLGAEAEDLSKGSLIPGAVSRCVGPQSMYYTLPSLASLLTRKGSTIYATSLCRSRCPRRPCC